MPTVAVRVQLLSVRVPGCQKLQIYKGRLNPVWHRMVYSCTRMATVGVKELTLPSTATSLAVAATHRTVYHTGELNC